MSETENKPCPFCGGKMLPEWEPLEHDADPIHFLNCQRCGSQGPIADSKEEAVAMGNMRGIHALNEEGKLNINHQTI